MKLLISFLSFTFLTSLFSFDVKLAPSYGYNHTENLTPSDQELYAVNNLVYGVKFEAGVPVLSLVGKFKTLDHTASGGIKSVIERSDKNKNHTGTTVLTLDLAQEDLHVLKNEVETLTKVTLDGRVGYKKDLVRGGEKQGDLGFEFLGGYLLDTKSTAKKDGSKQENQQIEVSGTGPRVGLKVLGSYKLLFAEVAAQHGNYKIKVEGEGSRDAKETMFEARTGLNFDQKFIISFYAKSRFDQEQVDYGSRVNDEPRSSIPRIKEDNRLIIGSELQFQFSFERNKVRRK